MVPGIGRPMLLFRGMVDRLGELPVYIRDGFLVCSQRSYACGCCEITVIRICGSIHIFMCFACTGILIYPMKLLTVC